MHNRNLNHMDLVHRILWSRFRCTDIELPTAVVGQLIAVVVLMLIFDVESDVHRIHCTPENIYYHGMGWLARSSN